MINEIWFSREKNRLKMVPKKDRPAEEDPPVLFNHIVRSAKKIK
jgi:hypothetical protein